MKATKNVLAQIIFSLIGVSGLAVSLWVLWFGGFQGLILQPIPDFRIAFLGLFMGIGIAYFSNELLSFAGWEDTGLKQFLKFMFKAALALAAVTAMLIVMGVI
jgi:hypothetical protein